MMEFAGQTYNPYFASEESMATWSLEVKQAAIDTLAAYIRFMAPKLVTDQVLAIQDIKQAASQAAILVGLLVE